MLYGISDVGNIGAITRTAYALGVGALIFIGEKLAMEGVSAQAAERLLIYLLQ